jgi:insulysin
MSHPSWLSGSEWVTVPAKDGVPEYAFYTGPLPKPLLDDRGYRLIRLSNGVQGVLVHDPQADKAAASVKVHTGHMQDPVCGCAKLF